ncbi:MAG: Ig-like domain-containing protein [Planctomycetota bacterium]|nr:Ig-like domain-containing protein [Planctomycetota bacterium]
MRSVASCAYFRAAIRAEGCARADADAGASRDAADRAAGNSAASTGILPKAAAGVAPARVAAVWTALVSALILCAAAVSGGQARCGESPQLIVIRSVSDSPDPFAPPGQSCAISAGYDHIVPGFDVTSRFISLRHVVRDRVEIRSAAGAPVRALEASASASAPTGGTLWSRRVTVLQHVWDGRDSTGRIVEAGQYSYSARGELAILIRVEVPRPGRPPIVLDHSIVLASSGTLSGTVTVGGMPDTLPPVISDLKPAGGSLLRVRRPEISASFSDPAVPGQAVSGVDPASAVIKLDGSDVTASANVTEKGFSLTPASDLADGARTVSVSLKDRAGNAASASWTFTVDATPPRISGMNPADGAMLNTSRPEFSGSFSDNGGSGVDAASASALLDGRAVVFGPGDVTAAGFRYTPDLPLEEGPHTFAVFVRDRAGNEASAFVPFRIDLTAPSASDLLPADGSYVNGRTFERIAAGFSDPPAGTAPGSGVDAGGVRVLVNGTDVTGMAGYSVWAVGFSYVPLEALPEGVVEVEAAIPDRAGNVGRARWSFTLDRTAPAVRIERPAGGAWLSDRRPVLRGTVSDALSGLGEGAVAMLLDGNSVSGTFEGGVFQCSPDFDLAEGPHTFRVVARDRAGNVGEASVTFTVDTIPPPAPVVTAVVRGTDRVTVSGDSPPDVNAIEAQAEGATVESAAIASFTAVFRRGESDTFTYRLRFIDRAGNTGPWSVWAEERFEAATPPLDLRDVRIHPEDTGFERNGVFYTRAERPRVEGRIYGGSGEVTVRVDGEAVYAGGGSFLWTPAAVVPEGPATFTVEAGDSTGRTVFATVRCVVDRSPPRIVLKKPLKATSGPLGFLYLARVEKEPYTGPEAQDPRVLRNVFAKDTFAPEVEVADEYVRPVWCGAEIREIDAAGDDLEYRDSPRFYIGARGDEPDRPRGYRQYALDDKARKRAVSVGPKAAADGRMEENGGTGDGGRAKFLFGPVAQGLEDSDRDRMDREDTATPKRWFTPDPLRFYTRKVYVLTFRAKDELGNETPEIRVGMSEEEVKAAFGPAVWFKVDTEPPRVYSTQALRLAWREKYEEYRAGAVYPPPFQSQDVISAPVRELAADADTYRIRKACGGEFVRLDYGSKICWLGGLQQRWNVWVGALDCGTELPGAPPLEVEDFAGNAAGSSEGDGAKFRQRRIAEMIGEGSLSSPSWTADAALAAAGRSRPYGESGESLMWRWWKPWPFEWKPEGVQVNDPAGWDSFVYPAEKFYGSSGEFGPKAGRRNLWEAATVGWSRYPQPVSVGVPSYVFRAGDRFVFTEESGGGTYEVAPGDNMDETGYGWAESVAGWPPSGKKYVEKHAGVAVWGIAGAWRDAEGREVGSGGRVALPRDDEIAERTRDLYAETDMASIAGRFPYLTGEFRGVELGGIRRQVAWERAEYARGYLGIPGNEGLSVFEYFPEISLSVSVRGDAEGSWSSGGVLNADAWDWGNGRDMREGAEGSGWLDRRRVRPGHRAGTVSVLARDTAGLYDWHIDRVVCGRDISGGWVLNHYPGVEVATYEERIEYSVEKERMFNLLEVRPGILLAGRRQTVRIRGGEIGEVSADPAAPGPAVVFRHPGGGPDGKIRVISAKIIHDNVFESTVCQTIEAEVEIADDVDLGLKDIDLTTSGGLASHILRGTANVIRFGFIDSKGKPITFSTAVSAPHPIIAIDPISAGDITLTGNIATFTLSGTVTDPVADITPGHAADIESVTVGNLAVPLKRVDDSTDRSPTRPYPFKAVFSRRISVPLANGANSIVASAVNVLGKKASATLKIDAEVTVNGAGIADAGDFYLPSDPLTVEVDAPLDPAVPDSIVAYLGDKPPGSREASTLREEETDSMVFAGETDDLGKVRITIREIPAFDPGTAEELKVEVESGKIGFHTPQEIVLVETSACSRVFRMQGKKLTVRLGGPFNPEVPDGIFAFLDEEDPGNAVLTETGPDTRIFTGNTPDLGEATVALVNISGLNPAATDTMLVAVTIGAEDLDGALFLLVETDPNSRIFTTKGMGLKPGGLSVSPLVSHPGTVRVLLNGVETCPSSGAYVVNPINVVWEDRLVREEDIPNVRIKFLGREWPVSYDEHLGTYTLGRPFMAVEAESGSMLADGIIALGEIQGDETVARYNGVSVGTGWTVVTDSDLRVRARGTRTVVDFKCPKFSRIKPEDISAVEIRRKIRWLLGDGETDPGATFDMSSLAIVRKEEAGAGETWLLQGILNVAPDADLDDTRSVFIRLKKDPDRPIRLLDCLLFSDIKVVLVCLDGVNNDAFAEAVRGYRENGREYKAKALAKVCGDDFENVWGSGKADADAPAAPPKALNTFPTVTFSSWTSIFTGLPPKENGILGNSMFARDKLRTLACSVNLRENSGDSLNLISQRKGHDIESFLKAGAQTLANLIGNRKAHVGHMFVTQSKEPDGSKGNWPRVKRVAFPNLSSTFVGTAHRPAVENVLIVPMLDKIIKNAHTARLQSRHDEECARNLDTIAFSDPLLLNLWELHPSVIPDLIIVYASGPDTAGHHFGGTRRDRTTALGAAKPVVANPGSQGSPRERAEKVKNNIRDYVVDVVDPMFRELYDHIREKGMVYATVFGFVSDHGMSAVGNDDRHVVWVTEKRAWAFGDTREYHPGDLPILDPDRTDIPREALRYKDYGMAATFNSLNTQETPEIAKFVTFDFHRLGLSRVVCSANGGMAHIYLAPEGNVPDKWRQFAGSDVIAAVAHAIYQQAAGISNLTPDLRDALGSPPAILVKLDSFSSNYQWYDGSEPDLRKRFKSLDALWRARRDRRPQEPEGSEWGSLEEFRMRIQDEMNDRDVAGSRSGDIVLIFDMKYGGYQTGLPYSSYFAVTEGSRLVGRRGDQPWPWYYGEPGEHGSPSPEESATVFAFAFQFRNVSSPADPERILRNELLERAAGAAGLEPGRIRSWHVTPMVRRILGE